MIAAPVLPDTARGILKSTITTLAHVGLLSSADAELLLALLGLRDA